MIYRVKIGKKIGIVTPYYYRGGGGVLTGGKGWWGYHPLKLISHFNFYAIKRLMKCNF